MRSIVYVDGKSSPAIFDSNKDDVRIVDEKEIDSLPDAVFEEIELIDVLEFSEDNLILQKVLRKMRHGGKIRIVGNDALQVLSAAYNGVCTLEQASDLILDGRKRLISAHKVRDMLGSVGLKVTMVGIVGNRYSLEAQRQ